MLSQLQRLRLEQLLLRLRDSCLPVLTSRGQRLFFHRGTSDKCRRAARRPLRYFGQQRI